MNIKGITSGLWKDKGNLFVLQMAAVYLSWKLIYHFIETDAGRLRQWWDAFIEKLGIVYAEVTNRLLQMMGEATIRIGSEVHYYETSRVIKVEEHCLAIPAMYIYTLCILIFSGDWKHKAWYIPMGLLGIACINIGRLVVLSFIFANLPSQYFIFHHSFLFVVITYSLVLLLIYVWMKYFNQVNN